MVLAAFLLISATASPGAWAASGGASAQSIAVVHGGSAQFRAAAEAVAACLSTRTAAVTALPHDSSASADVLDRLRGRRPRVLVAVGARAVGAVARAFPDSDLVYLGVVSPARLGLLRRERAYGIAWLPAPEEAARVLGLLFSRGTRMGTISSRSRRALAPMERAFANHGLELVRAEVDGSEDLPEALRDLRRRGAAALWLGVDRVTSEPDGFAIVRDAALQFRLPLVAPFDPGPDGKVLAGVWASPQETAAAACRAVRSILNDRTPPALTALDSAEFSIDLGVAGVLGHTVPETALKAATRLYHAP